MKLIYSILSLISFNLILFNSNQNIELNKIKLNDIQVIGSHNSYKIKIEKPLFNYLLEKNSSISALEYEHIPLTEQLNLGLRGLELDVFNDPKGSYYSNPQGLDILKSMDIEPMPFDVEKKLQTPGLKVFHIQEIDFRSHQLLFKDALKELKEWSEVNVGHSPIIITINTKDGEIAQTRKPIPFSAEALLSIDEEILEVFSQKSLITPDLVRGDFETLEKAILANGWPLLNEVKNKFLFVLDEGAEKTNRYLSNFSNLKGAVLFVNVEEGNQNAAFRIINNPIENIDKIKKLVALGYMIRTRADADTKEARNNDFKQFEIAKASGAQIITTDYYLPSKLFKSNYKVSFDNSFYERIRKLD
jgi:hypothetical protein